MSAFAGEDTSSTLRFALWESTLAMIRDFPWTGIGWGAYRLVYHDYDFFVQDRSVVIYHAHNLYLNIAAEVGLPGLLVFLLLAGGHVYLVLSAFKGAGCAAQRACAIGLCAALFGVLIGGVTDYVLFNMELASLFWLLNALIVVLWRQTRSFSWRSL